MRGGVAAGPASGVAAARRRLNVGHNATEAHGRIIGIDIGARLIAAAEHNPSSSQNNASGCEQPQHLAPAAAPRPVAVRIADIKRPALRLELHVSIVRHGLS